MGKEEEKNEEDQGATLCMRTRLPKKGYTEPANH
jgi:hypothetical protein